MLWDIRLFRFSVSRKVRFDETDNSGPGSCVCYSLIAFRTGERAKTLELKTPCEPPPGVPLAHHAAGYAKIMCSAVFITGLDPDFAAAKRAFAAFWTLTTQRPASARGVVTPSRQRANQAMKPGKAIRGRRAAAQRG
jgi:hypothetical protein